MKVLGDYKTSVIRALSEIDPHWEEYDGLVICGTHVPRISELDLVLEDIKEARKKGTPVYAECFGYQLCAVEYARNVLGIKDATSEEFGRGTLIVRKRPEGLNVGLHDGESYWNNYEVDSFFLEKWNIPPQFFIAQYHASYQSSLLKPHKLIKNFLRYAKKHHRSNHH